MSNLMELNKTLFILENLTTPQTEYNIKSGHLSIGVVRRYRYLGVILNDTLDFNVIVNVLADGWCRALGAIINKYEKLGGLGYYTYTTMYNADVCPILNYAANIWGYKDYSKIIIIQNWAIQVFMGVHNFAPNLGITGDFGCTVGNVRCKVGIIQF